MSKKLLIGSLVLSAGILALAAGPLRPKPRYTRSVVDVLKHDIRDERTRVQGVLVKGSLCEIEPGCGYRFKMADSYWNDPIGPKPTELSVLYEACVIPDTFRDVPGLDVELTVEGERCQTCHDFKADQIMAKCPSKYQMYLDGGHPSSKPPPRCSELTPRM